MVKRSNVERERVSLEAMMFHPGQSVRTANLPVLNAYADQVGTVVGSKPAKTQVRFACPDYTVTLWFLDTELTAV